MELTQFHKTQMESILGSGSILPFETFITQVPSNESMSIFTFMKKNHPNSLGLKLTHFLDSPDPNFRGKCVYLLYILLTDDHGYIWNNCIIKMSTQSTIKSTLLIRINLEESKSVIHRLCHVVSNLCNVMLHPFNNWPELFHLLHECVASDSNRLNECFFVVFTYLARDICRKLFPDIMILHPLLLKTMNDDTLDLESRITALSAAVNFVMCLFSLNEIKRVESLYPAMMMTLTDTLSEDVVARKVLEHFTKLAKNEPRFFRIHLVDAVNTMFEIAEDMNLEEKTRHLALEFLLTLVEARKKAPGMMKKLPLFTYTCFALLLKLLLDIKDEPSWHSVENYLDGETYNYIFGLKSLVRFSKALGGKTVAFIAIEQIGAYLVSPKWEKRHAALTALVYISEGCSKMMIKYLEHVVSMVLLSFQDPDPPVRLAAIKAIGQFFVVLSPDLQERHHNRVVPALTAAMDDFQNPRVQALAAAAVANFCSSGKLETLAPYLDNILIKLLVLLQNDNQMVQQEAIDALTNVANLSGEHFRENYDLVMPYMKIMLVNMNDMSNPVLRSRVLKCMSVVGLVTGKEKFRDDAKQVVEVLKSSHISQVKEFDTIFHILWAWERICKCMGKDFLSYMSIVMPLLVKCAQLEIDDTIDDYIYKVKFGDKMIYTRESDFIKVKSIACGFFGSYALVLEEAFYPWISQATSILLPLLKFYIHNEVTRNACSAIHMMLVSAKLVSDKGTSQGENESYFKQLSSDIILALGEALYLGPETKACESILGALSACLEICGPLLNEDQVRSIIEWIKHVTTESSCRREELTERESSEDFDAEEAELLWEEREQELKLFAIVSNILVTFIDTFEDAFFPFLEELPSYLMPMRSKDTTAIERSSSIRIFSTLVKKCGEAASKYYNEYLPFLLDSIMDEDPLVRQHVLHGVACCAQYGNPLFKPFAGEALSRINEVITHVHAHVLENECANEYAVYALGIICMCHWESIDSMQAFPALLNCLPMKGSKFIAQAAHFHLCEVVERSGTEILGLEYEHLPRIISVFAEIVCVQWDSTEGDPTIIEVPWNERDFGAEGIANSIIKLLKNLQETIPPATWEWAWSLLLPQHEMELESRLSHVEFADILLALSFMFTQRSEGDTRSSLEKMKKEKDRKGAVQKFKTAMIVSGVIVVVAGAVFAITKKLKETSN